MYALKGFSEKNNIVVSFSLENKNAFIPTFPKHSLRKGGVRLL